MFDFIKVQNPFRRSKPSLSALSSTDDVTGSLRNQNGASPPPPSNDASSPEGRERTGLKTFSKTDSYGLKVLHEPQSATLDIIFVHGLTGSAYSTWLYKSNNTHWPRDLLKQDISDARIMTFGYDADIVNFWGQAAQDGISGYAKDLLGKLSKKRLDDPNRKVVFVAHSLGGLVTQRALTISREINQAHLNTIEACTVGICFLGTPHHGADLAKWGSMLVSIVNIAKPANSAPVELLKRGSEMLGEVQDGFHNLLEKRKDEGIKIGITCFYETLPVIRTLIVPKESAIIDGELSFPLRANHTDMTKFSDRDAAGYEDVVGEIQRLANYGTRHNSGTKIEESMSPNHIQNHSSGTQNVNTGDGTQNNNTGNGRQFIGTNQYFGQDG